MALTTTYDQGSVSTNTPGGDGGGGELGGPFGDLFNMVLKRRMAQDNLKMQGEQEKINALKRDEMRKSRAFAEATQPQFGQAAPRPMIENDSMPLTLSQIGNQMSYQPDILHMTGAQRKKFLPNNSQIVNSGENSGASHTSPTIPGEHRAIEAEEAPSDRERFVKQNPYLAGMLGNVYDKRRQTGGMS